MESQHHETRVPPKFHLIMAQLGQSLIQKSLLGLEQNEQEKCERRRWEREKKEYFGSITMLQRMMIKWEEGPLFYNWKDPKPTPKSRVQNIDLNFRSPPPLDLGLLTLQAIHHNQGCLFISMVKKIDPCHNEA